MHVCAFMFVHVRVHACGGVCVHSRVCMYVWVWVLKIILYISTGVESKVPRPLVSFSSKQRNRKISSAAQWEERTGDLGCHLGEDIEGDKRKRSPCSNVEVDTMMNWKQIYILNAMNIIWTTSEGRRSHSPRWPLRAYALWQLLKSEWGRRAPEIAPALTDIPAIYLDLYRQTGAYRIQNTFTNYAFPDYQPQIINFLFIMI